MGINDIKMIRRTVKSATGISFGGNWYWFKRERFTFRGNVRRGHSDNIFYSIH